MSVIVGGWNESAARLYTSAGYAALAREPAILFPGCPHHGDWVLMVKVARGRHLRGASCQDLTAKFVLALFAAGALSFLAGYAFTELIALIPCRGENLACNVDQAIGGYAVVIWAILGPLIFGLVLAIARNRAALARRCHRAADTAGRVLAAHADRARDSLSGSNRSVSSGPCS